MRNARASSELHVQLEAHLQIAASPVPSNGVISCWMNVKKRLTWTALRTRDSDVAPCTCSRDESISTAAFIASFVCVRTPSDVTRIESPRWCVDTAMLGRFVALSLSLVRLLVSSLPKVTPSAFCRLTGSSGVRRFDLLPELIDGLVWRSRDIVAPGCRVDYYIRHVPLNKDNSRADASFSAIRCRTARHIGFTSACMTTGIFAYAYFPATRFHVEFMMT